jgi:peptidoglycan/xylan/chitin deacetylase (PgdA/CDA1 family)
MRLPSVVLCYHAVAREWTDSLSVAPERLERQVRWLLRLGYRGASAEEALHATRGALHVTFDDAYRSVEAAIPVLRALGVPVTVFACTSYADDGRELDVSELRGRARDRPGELATMTWEMLAGVSSASGVTIGSHTVSHPHLPRLSDIELRRELLESREQLEDRLRRPCGLVAYPYGEHDARVRAAARAAGYSLAYALDPAAGGRDDFAIPRVDVYRRDGGGRFLLKALPTGRPVAAVTNALRAVADGRAARR